MVSRKKEKAQLTRPARFITKEITEDEIPYQLPKSWKWVRLYDICSLVTDVNHKMPRAVVDGVKFISAKDLVSGGRINLENDVKRISEEDFAQLGKRVIPQRGDIIYSRIGTIGKSRIVKTDERFMVSYSLCVIRPSNVNANYLNYYLDSGIVLEQAKKEARSIGVPDLGMQSIKNFLVALPPPAEQERIVAKIEELFTQLEAGTSALAKVQAGLRWYKASVLKAAVEGRLLETRELEIGGLPEGWRWVKVKEAGKVQLGRQRAPQHHEGKYMRPYLRVANVFEDRLDLSDVKEMNFTPAEYETYKLEYGDILLNEGQSPELLGRPAMYRGEVPGSCFQNTLIRFQAFDFVDRNFALIVFRHYMHSGRFAQESQITTNIAHLSAGRFGNVEFPIPPLEDQRRIVAEVERRLSVARQVESSVEAALARAARLRQSVLRSAFEGRLL